MLFCSIILIFLINISNSEVWGQHPNVQMRSNQPIAWFDTVYKDCAAVYAQLRTESRKMAADDVYNEIVQPILASIYHSLGRDLDKRAFYWELEDGIWQVDPQKPFNTQLANNYVNASGDSFILKEFMRNLASKTATIDNIEMIRKASDN